MSVKKLFIPPIILCLLIGSWLFPSTRFYWDALDLKTFTYLNTWVQTHPFWQHLWAFTGTRVMDYVHDGLMFLFFFYSIKKAASALKNRKVAELLFSICFIALVILIVNGTLFPEFLHFPRKSPTMVDKTAFRLSSVIEWTKVKDHSRASFPGDHATTAVTFACLIFYLMGPRLGLLATLYAIFFCLPRLVVGAHWLTDNIMGSAAIAVLATSLAFGTPFANWAIGWLEKGINRLRRPQPCPET